MTESRRAKLVLTPEQRAIVARIQQEVEKDKPEILAEGRRFFAAEEILSVRLRAAMTLLKAVRMAQGVTLGEIAASTGMSKPSLSRLETDATANITVNTLYRIADALGHDLQVSVIPRSPVFTKSPSKPKTRAKKTQTAK